LNKQNPENDPLYIMMREKITEQKETIERLEKQLDEARATIAHKDEQIEIQAARLASITEKQQELLYNQQVLQAQTQKKGFFARLFAPKESTSK
jgi:chromosome segregation ATPase